MEFIKVQGLGNDFLVVRADEAPSPQWARRVCERRFGVGADGVLAILPPSSPDEALRMVVINADGTRPEMCGNGLRCVAAEALGWRSGAIRVGTDAGVYECVVTGQGEGAAAVVVQMGAISFVPEDAGVVEQGALVAEASGLSQVSPQVEGQRVPLWVASAGNPHGVCVVDDPAVDLRALAQRLGPTLSLPGVFTQGVNVTWARVGAEGVEMVVHERGAGLTLACGTAACATAAVLVKLGRLDLGAAAKLRLPGGPLEICVGGLETQRAHPVIMTGPATCVYKGRL